MFNSNWDPYQELIDCQAHLNQVQANTIELALMSNNHGEAIHKLAQNQQALENQMRMLRAEIASYRLELQQQKFLPNNRN